MKTIVQDCLNDEGDKVPTILMQPESVLEVELMTQLGNSPGYLNHLRNLVEHVFDEMSDPPNGPEDF